MVKNHLKSLHAPKTWSIQRKEKVFIARPLPGSSFRLGMPLLVVLRDMLRLVKTRKEAWYIIKNKDLLVNNAHPQEDTMMVGFMDTLSVPKIKKHYRLLLNNKQKLFLQPIPEAEASKKICEIVGKTPYKGKLQVNLFDGRNLLIDKNAYHVGDSLVITLPKPSIEEHLPLGKHALILLIGGKHIGEKGIVEFVQGDLIRYKRDSGEVYETKKRYAFVIGKQKEALSLS